MNSVLNFKPAIDRDKKQDGGTGMQLMNNDLDFIHQIKVLVIPFFILMGTSSLDVYLATGCSDLS
jgi:hypothetical protein